MSVRLKNWISGAYVSSSSPRSGTVFNPATGEAQAEVPLADAAEIDKAVKSSLAAFAVWSETAVPKRMSVMFKMRDLVIQNSNRLAELIGKEHGKTIADALGEIQRGIDVLEFACGMPQLIKGDFNSQVGGQIDAYSMREPVGVVAGISPFNFPVMIPLWMGAVAVAAGCAFLNKPSERDPSSSMLIGELWKEAGLPDGVWNVVNGDKAAVDALLVHPDIAAVSFVGSTPVAEYIYAKASAAGKRVQAFGGAKNHMVVMPDADLDQAADALVSAGYGSAGQRCMAISVAVPVGEATADALVERMLPRIRALKVGIYSDAQADMGPLVTRESKDRVQSLIGKGAEEGAEVLVDGRGMKLQGFDNGFFVGPTLLDHVKPEMDVYKAEIFGPVLSVVRATSFDHAVDIINGNEYGNGVALFTRDGDLAQKFTRRVDVGMIGINVPIPVPLPFHHFGGSKRSKFGDTQMYGPDSVKFFTKMKTVSQRWPSSIQKGVSLAFGPGR